MFRDKSLVPSEAIRLLALGLLAEQSCSYAALAEEVRRTSGLLVGPSLDLLAPPLQLLQIEGLAEEADGRLALTPSGRRELERLLTAPLRQPANDLHKLVMALKLRFLCYLPEAQQILELETLAEAAERERARLAELARGAEHRGHFGQWLALERSHAEARLLWLRQRVAAAEPPR